jgi:uncharacterized protein
MKKYIQIPILLGLIVSQATINRIEALNWKETLYTLCALGGIGICAYRIVQKNKQNEALIKEKESTEEIRRLNNQLIDAAKDNNSEQVGALLAVGAQVNAQDIYGSTALMRAAGRGHTATVEQLLSAGAQVNSHDNGGETALMEAAWYGHTAIVKALLAADADINTQKNYDWTALKFGEELLAVRADINKPSSLGVTALMCAAHHGHTEIVEQLLDAGADATLRNRCGQSALELARIGNYDIARRINHDEIVTILEEHEQNGGIGLGPKAAFKGV